MPRWFKRSAAVVVASEAAALAGLYVWASPSYNDSGTHSAFTERDLQHLRYVSSASSSSAAAEAPPSTAAASAAIHASGGSSGVALAAAGAALGVDAAHNPGVRVFPQALSPEETRAVVHELQGVKQRYGFNLISPAAAAMYHWQMSYLTTPPPVNMLRVTGRPEHPTQTEAPWGYGDTFDESKLPPNLQQLAKRLRSLPGLRLGPLRDVTVNFRRHSFFRLDPHVDPAADGDDVIIVGLDSDTVLTLSPQHWRQLEAAARAALGLLTMEDERDVVRRCASTSSWSSQDIDVLAPARAAVVLSGDARWRWGHGTRLGVEVPGSPRLQDWWGSPVHLVPRSQERHSVVFAFGPPSAASSRG